QGVRRGPAVGPRPQERAELLTKGPAMSDTETIVSGDVRREQRIPPGQVLTRKWPVLHAGVAPPFDPATWDFRVDGLVKPPRTFTFDEFRALSRVTVRADMHCVTRWSKLDNVWEGVPTRELLKHVELLPSAQFVMVVCEPPYPGEAPFTTNLPAA